MIEKRFGQLETDFVVAPMYLKEVSRIQALLCVYFLTLLVESLLERELRRAMEREGIASVSLYPEGRACRRPTARKVIDLFEDVQRHELTAGRRPAVVFTTKLSRLQRADPPAAEHEGGLRHLTRLTAAMEIRRYSAPDVRKVGLSFVIGRIGPVSSSGSTDPGPGCQPPGPVPKPAGGRTGPDRPVTPAGGTGPRKPETGSDPDRPSGGVTDALVAVDDRRSLQRGSDPNQPRTFATDRKGLLMPAAARAAWTSSVPKSLVFSVSNAFVAPGNRPAWSRIEWRIRLSVGSGMSIAVTARWMTTGVWGMGSRMPAARSTNGNSRVCTSFNKSSLAIRLSSSRVNKVRSSQRSCLAVIARSAFRVRVGTGFGVSARLRKPRTTPYSSRTESRRVRTRKRRRGGHPPSPHVPSRHSSGSWSRRIR